MLFVYKLEYINIDILLSGIWTQHQAGNTVLWKGMPLAAILTVLKGTQVIQVSLICSEISTRKWIIC